MNGGPLPPVPDLIPIAALRKEPIKNKQHKEEKVRQQSCAPNTTRGEVMGEQRSRRTGKQPAVDLIDSLQSRGASAAPQARKARSERHRKSDRRREHKGSRKRSSSKHRSRSSKRSSPERHPRVNPIFVWVRQEDTHIVDVKCEDYDKRNRILLTKTAQGWRAIPRTETLVPSLREADDEHNRHRIRKASKKSCKVKRKSTAVQVDGDMTDEVINNSKDLPTWTTPVNIESHLPSHTIHIPKRRCTSEDHSLEAEDISSVNSDVNCSAQTQDVKCSASKSCDVTSPLDNLLAVAELEFNNQIQRDEWDKASVAEETSEGNVECVSKSSYTADTEEPKEYLDETTQLNKFIDNCSNDNREEEEEDIRNEHSHHFDDQKLEECDYNEEEENNTVMDDILSRLEQSLRSPSGDYHEQSEEITECNSSEEVVSKESQIKTNEVDTSEMNNEKDTVPESNSYFEQKEAEPEKEQYSINFEEPDVLVGSSTNIDTNEDVPTDLTVSKSRTDSYSADTNCDDMVPTDLSIPKIKPLAPLRPLTPPSPSQNSETIQSPQPSGIPAVPPSPDIFHNSNNNKSKSIFLESLLTAANQKIMSNPEVTITRQKEPLDLGKCRKSASPTVTCSEEVKNSSMHNDLEPLAKKFKIEDITLKTLLDPELIKTLRNEEAKAKNATTPETPRLLELLTSDTEIDALTQLKQVLADTSLKVPDPMLVPKDRLSLILSSPAKEIPRLLKQRPELRLPEALAYPHLLQDPDILVITLSQLHTIIQKQCQPIPIKTIKNIEQTEEKINEDKEIRKRDSPKVTVSHTKTKPTEEEPVKSIEHNKKDGQGRASINELANDIDAATNAAFNQMMWLPYLNQLEAAASTFGNSPDFMKMLSNMFPMYSGQVPDMSHLFNTRIPPPLGFPLQSPVNYNPLEYSMWQEAIMQANMLRPKNPFEAFGQKNNYRECLERTKIAGVSKKPNINQKLPHLPDKFNGLQNPFYMPNMHSTQNSFSNLPGPFTHGNNAGQNVQMPSYNQLISQQNSISERKSSNQTYTSKSQYSKFDQMQMSKTLASNHLYNQHRSQNQQQMNNMKADVTSHRTKMQNKSLMSMSGYHRTTSKDITRKYEEASKQTTQPIDLSGSCGSKLKVRQHLIDQVNTPKLLKHDDAPEVGSTTASIEEMQESQKHLWHPLFGK